MSVNKLLDSIFKEFLDGKSGKVSSEGLHIQGATDGRVHFKHSPTGLHCLGELRFNDESIFMALQEELNKEREALKLSFDTRNSLQELMQGVIEDFSVKYATISPSGTKSFKTHFNDNDEVMSLSITYKDGSTTTIEAIS